MRRASLTAVLLLPLVSQAGFKIGQYELGMSHRQAAKLGLTACRDASEREIQCIPTGLPDVSATTKYVWFDRKTQKLTTMLVESVQFHPFPDASDEGLWRDATARYDNTFIQPLGLLICGTGKPEVETYIRSKVITCVAAKSSEYRQVKVGYNREEIAGSRSRHSTPGNTPNVGATVMMGSNEFIKRDLMFRKSMREEDTRKEKRAAELRRFEKGM